MKAAPARALLTLLGLLLVGWGMAPRQITPAAAAPRMLVTETPPVEPPTSTPVPPTNTPAPPTVTPPAITNTPAPPTVTPPAITNTPAPPTEVPRDEGGDDPSDPAATPSSTPLPTATPTAGPPAPAADPAISKSVSPAAAVAGDEVTYTILVTNQGGAPATGVVVEDTLPAFLAAGEVSASRGQVSVSGQTVRVEIGELAAGETVEVRVRATVTATPAAPNNRNFAVVSSSSPDANPDNNQASVPLETIVPVALPATSAAADPLPALATILGLALIAASALVRRGARGGARRA
jgi:uncharacterized repeat protein (TIGR01451 family)